MLRLNLIAINRTLDNVFLKVIAINGTTATIRGTVGTINGMVTSIDDNTTIIVIPDLCEIRSDMSDIFDIQADLQGSQEAYVILQFATLAWL